MSTISVPLSAEETSMLDSLVAVGTGSSRADVMRRGLELISEEQAVLSVLKSEQEIAEGKILRGDARTILLGK